MHPSFKRDIFKRKILLHIRWNYGDMVGELMCETKYSSAKIYVDEHYRQICFKFRDIISDSK